MAVTSGVLENLGSLELIGVGAAATSALLLPAVLLFRSHAKDAQADRRRLEGQAARAHEILAASPDGILMWDHATGGIMCSRRLADMLELKAGTLARYDDIRACFEGDELGKLERGVSLLRAKGTPFETLLRQGSRTIQALGTRAAGEQPVADIVWMRDVTAAAGLVPAEETSRNRSGIEDRHLTALLDILPIPLWLRDPSLAVVFANRAAENIDGLDAGIAEEARSARRTTARALEITESGVPVRVHVLETPLGELGGGDASGEGGGTIGFAVPDQAPAQTAPSGTEAAPAPFPAELIRPLDAGVAVFEADGTLAAANPAYAELWRLDADWLDTRPSMGDLLLRLRELRRLPEVTDFAGFRREEMARLAGLTDMHEDLLHLPDGRDIRRRIAPLPGGGIVVACDDLSGRHELQRTVTAQDRVQRTTLENLREGVAVFGGDGRLRLVNRTLATLFELKPEETDGDVRLGDLLDAFGRRFIGDGQPWPERKDRIAAAVMARRAGTGTVELINGRVFAFANVPLPDGAVLVSYADITDSFRVEQALRDRARVLAETDKMKTQFIANVAHEVRTPLTTISGFAEILTEQMFGTLNERQIGYTRGILETAHGMRDVVTDIFDLATIEAGRMELDVDTVDPHAIIVAAIGGQRDRMRRKSIELVLDCPPDIGWITADERRLRQIVANLLANAVAFTPKLGRISVGAERRDDVIDIWVSDTGPGIPKDDRERVFNPFDRGGKSGSRAAGTGAGLGLTIVRRFAELHGGGVEIASNRERGAKVTVTLPVDASARRELASTGGNRAIVDGEAAE